MDNPITVNMIEIVHLKLITFYLVVFGVSILTIMMNSLFKQHNNYEISRKKFIIDIIGITILLMAIFYFGTHIVIYSK